MTHTPLRVLFVTHGFPRFAGDAAGAFVLSLARAVQREGVDVRVLAPASSGIAATDVVDGVPVTRFRYAPRSWETLAYRGTMAEQVRGSLRGKLALALLLWRGRRAVRRMISTFSPDVVHAHWWFPSGLMSGGLGVPMIVTMHGSDVRLATGTPARRLLGRVAAQSSALYAVSGWLARTAASALGGRSVATGPMPANTSLFMPQARVPRLSDRLLFVGRLNAQKGPRDLLAAMARSRTAWSLDVVGDGPDRTGLELQARTLGIGDRIAWLGHLPQTSLPALYARSAALLVPSIDEGLGLVGVEAALCETPAIAYASGGLPDVVADGVTGWLVPGGDVAALANVIDDVVARPSLARERGITARARALETFSPDAVGAHYRAAYDHVCQAR